MIKVKNNSEPDDLITQKEAAEVSGRSIAAINELVRRGRIASFEKYGKNLVSKSEMLAFEPDKGGRPPKPKGSGMDGHITAKPSKKGGKK